LNRVHSREYGFFHTGLHRNADEQWTTSAKTGPKQAGQAYDVLAGEMIRIPIVILMVMMAFQHADAATTSVKVTQAARGGGKPCLDLLRLIYWHSLYRRNCYLSANVVKSIKEEYL